MSSVLDLILGAVSGLYCRNVVANSGLPGWGSKLGTSFVDLWLV